MKDRGLFLIVLAALVTLALPAAAEEVALTTPSCPVRLEQRTIRGDSLFPRWSHGDVVTLAMDPAACLPIARGDLVAARNPRDAAAPLLKVVRGLPGDRFQVVSAADGTYHLHINGAVVRNAAGAPYAFTERRSRMLALCERHYGGLVPAGAYLLLGEAPSGSYDSSRFGLVERRHLVGMLLRAEGKP